MNPVYGGFASAGNYQVVGAAAQYGTSGFVLGVNYSNVGFRDLNDPSSGTLTLTNPRGYTGNAVFNSFGAYVRYSITPAFWLNGGYSYIVGGAVDGKDSAKYNLFNVGIDYFLSKRTDLYCIATYALASGTDSTGQKAVASVLAVTPSNTSHQVILVTGIRHLF